MVNKDILSENTKRLVKDTVLGGLAMLILSVCLAICLLVLTGRV